MLLNDTIGIKVNSLQMLHKNLIRKVNTKKNNNLIILVPFFSTSFSSLFFFFQ